MFPVTLSKYRTAMIESDVSLGSKTMGPSICTRLVRIPVILFFLFSIIAQMIVQSNIAYRINHHPIEALDTPQKDETTKIGKVIGFGSIIPSELRQNGQRMLLDEHNGIIPPSHGLDFLEGNRASRYGDDSSTRENNKPVDKIHPEFFMINSVEKKTPNSQDDAKVKTKMDKLVIAKANYYNATNNTQPLSYQEKDKKNKRKTRAIFGIMTYDSDDERKRRGLIRSTFLSYFTKYMNRTLVTDEEYNEKKHWICSLNDLDRGRLEFPEKCRMAYAFVQGANPNGTTMLLNFNESYPLSLSPSKITTDKEKMDASDSIYLNIKENGRFGKTPTWFRYAIDVLERHGWMKDWDYIFKSDTDNLIYSPRFFRFMDYLPRKKAVRVYGGLPLDYKKCGGDKHDDCKRMIGPYFMQGGCYFLSIDLAKFISDETTFDHQAVKLLHEDMTTGNFVYSHPEKIKIIKEPKMKNVIRNHPVKKSSAYKFRWNKMLREEQIRLSTSR